VLKQEDVRRLTDDELDDVLEEEDLGEEEDEEEERKPLQEAKTVTQEELAARRIQTDSQVWKIKNLYDERKNFRPTRQQRDYIQKPEQASFFILSILYNLPMHPLMVIRKMDKDDSRYYEVSDGWQRLNTILLFKQGKIRTPTIDQVKKVNENCSLNTTDRPLTYGQLSKYLQVRFDEYKVPVIEMELPSELESMMFVNFNLQQNLQPGQEIWSYDSMVSDWAKTLWPWNEEWSTLYKSVARFKNDPFRERIMAIVEMLAIEVTGKKGSYITDLKRERIRRWGGRLYDKQITPEHMRTVERKLKVMAHLFFGAHVRSRSFFIAMYQAVSFLEDMGYVLETAPQGCLTAWLKKVSFPTRPGEFTAVMHMTDKKKQVEFWPWAIRELVSFNFLPIEGERGPLPDFSQYNYILQRPPRLYKDR
jgi:hypothetical protein